MSTVDLKLINYSEENESMKKQLMQMRAYLHLSKLPPQDTKKKNDHFSAILKDIILHIEDTVKDESFALKRRTKPKRVLLESDEEKEEQLRLKQERAEKRAARKAAEAAQAAEDAISDARDRQYREDVAGEKAGLQEEIAASNAAIAQALEDEDEGTCEPESTEDLVVDVPEKVPPMIRENDFELLNALFLEIENFESEFKLWLLHFNHCPYPREPRRWYTRLRNFFPCLAEVPDDILSQAVLAKIVTSTGFDIGQWKDQIREYYHIPGSVPDENLLSAVRIRIGYIFARIPEVYELILGTK
jgi:hypothetical protein